MSLSKVTEEWIPLQITVFTRWVNGHLKSIGDEEIQDVTQDLSTGVHLVHLAQVLTQKEPPRPLKKDPKMQVFMVQNCDLAIEMFQNDGVQLVSISGKDINDKNVKLILGLIWTLILYYSIGQSISSASFDSSQSPSKNSSKSALMDWAVKKTANYPNVHPNFQPYDLSICALLDSYVPDKINYNSLNPDETEQNVQLATNVMSELGIPVYIYPDDVIKSGNQVDDKTLLTQLSSAKVVLDRFSKAKERSINLEERKNTNSINEIIQLSNSKNEDESVKIAIRCLKYEVRNLKKAIEGKSIPFNNSEERGEYFTQQNEEVQRPTKDREEDKAEIEHLKNDISEIRTRLENHPTEIQILQQKEVFEKITKEMEEYKTEIECIRREFSEIRTQINTSKTDNESSQQNDEYKLEIERLNNDILSLRSELENSKKENEASQYAIKCLKYEVKQLKKNPDAPLVVQERSITIGEPEENNAQPAQQKEDVERLSKERDENKAEIERLRNDISDLRTQLEKSKNENNSIQEAINSLNNEFKSIKNNSEILPEVKERSATINSDANDQLRKDIESVQSELQRLNSKAQADNNKTYLFVFIILIVLLVCVKLL